MRGEGGEGGREQGGGEGGETVVPLSEWATLGNIGAVLSHFTVSPHRVEVICVLNHKRVFEDQLNVRVRNSYVTWWVWPPIPPVVWYMWSEGTLT